MVGLRRSKGDQEGEGVERPRWSGELEKIAADASRVVPVSLGKARFVSSQMLAVHDVHDLAAMRDAVREFAAFFEGRVAEEVAPSRGSLRMTVREPAYRHGEHEVACRLSRELLIVVHPV